MGMYETLMPDVVAPEAHQNDGSYVHELSGLTYDLLHKKLAWWVVTQRISKNHKTVKYGGWCLLRTIRYMWLLGHHHLHQNQQKVDPVYR